MLVVLIGVSPWLQFVVVTDLNGQMLTFDGVWHFGEVFSLRMNPGFHCTGQTADSMYGIMWVSGLLMSTLWIKWPMVAVGLWYGQAYFMDNKHRRILLMPFWMPRDTVTRSWGPLLCHSSTTITSCSSMIMHGPMLQGSVHNSWKLKTSQFLHGQHTHQTCHPLSMFRMYNTVKLHILEWPFIVASLRHTCAIIMLSNQHLDMPHLWGRWIISAKEKCSLKPI